MSGFSAEWLALRESHDLRARNPIVLEAVATLFKSHDAVSVVDLACGAGSTVRALSSHLPARQHWDLVDSDQRLLTLACSGKSVGDVRLNPVPLDLSGNFEAVLDSTKELITISALLDLVSETWLDRFARTIVARALPVYAALTYDGPHRSLPRRSPRCDDRVRGECPSAYRQGLWAGPGAFGCRCGRIHVRGARIFGRSRQLGLADRYSRPGDPA